MSLSQKFGFVFGPLYLLVGVAGFITVTSVGFSAAPGARLGMFELNPLHNLFHTVIGFIFVTSALLGPRAARVANFSLGYLYAVLGVVGFIVIGRDSFNFLALNEADNFLHIVTGVLSISLGARRELPVSEAEPGAESS